MRLGLVIAVAAAGILLCGCASVFEGTSQDISVNTNPSGATCAFERDGEVIGTIADTPSTLTVRKSKYDIYIRCNKEGYQQATYLNHSGVSAAIAANIAVDVLLTAGVSSIVDSATGADNKYDGAVNITMYPSTVSQFAAGPPAVTLPACTDDDKKFAKAARDNGYRYQPNCR